MKTPLSGLGLSRFLRPRRAEPGDGLVDLIESPPPAVVETAPGAAWPVAPTGPGAGLKVLHAPANIGNQPWTLSRAERALGAASDLIVNYGTWLKLPADRVLSEWNTSDHAALRERAVVGMTAPFDYDVLHYYFGRSLMEWDDQGARNQAPYADLRLAKALGKKVFMTLQGCDARLAGESNKRYAETACAQGRCSAFQACIDSYDASRRTMIETILPLCDRVFYLNPELGHYVGRGEFLPYANLDVRPMVPVAPRLDRPTRIVHGPSDPNVKGSERIIAALDALKGEFDFELVLVKGKTHAEAMALYQDSDLAIDQILCGWYGGFAVELMAMGKPVMCSIRDEDLAFVPPRMLAEMPILKIRPEALVEDLRAVLSARDQWLDWSARSRQFVLDWHEPGRIAAAMVRCYRDASAPFDLSA